MSTELSSLPNSVGIVGLGLIGGSLARSLKAHPHPPTIVASSLDTGALDRAREEGVADRTTRDPAEVAASAELIVYATPLRATLDLLGAHRDLWRPEAVLSDVVSLKEPVARKVRELGAGGRWVGSHPMAGSEESGFAASRADLFRSARTYLVRGEAGDDAAGTVESLWSGAGARVAWIDAAAHDRRMIWASHLPQLMANALAAALARAGLDATDLGPGGRDMTRLAGSSPDIWGGLLEAAGAGEEAGLAAAVRELERLREWLADGEVERVVEYMERTREWREGEAWS